MVLSFYSRKDSPWLWVQWRDGRGGKRRCEKTGLRVDHPDFARRKALLRLEWEKRLLLAGGDAGMAGLDQRENPGHVPTRTGHGWAWVPGYLATRYRAKAASRRVYDAQWRSLFEFFAEREILTPGGLDREDCFDYIGWRTGQVKKKSGKHPRLNTALGELKLLRLVMREAVGRGLAVTNPAQAMHVEGEDPEPKPDISDEDAVKIYAALENEAQWMQRSFFLALHTGLRFASTRLHRSQVHWAEGRIVIEKPKGGRKREFAIEIYPAIEPMLGEWHESGDPWFWTAPKGLPVSLRWRRFFDALGMPRVCFHCTRVAFITRGAMAGVPESAMMQMVNHAGAEIHRIYQRWKPGRFREFAAKISSSAPLPRFAGGATPGSRKKRTASRSGENPGH